MNNRTTQIFDAAKKSAKDYSFLEKIPIYFRLFKRWREGLYKPSKLNLWMIILGLIYIISPIDFIPEGIFLIAGLTDDLAVIALIFSRLNKELETFIQWENQSQTVSSNTIDTEAIIEK